MHRGSEATRIATVDGASIPQALRQTLGLLRDLQSTVMGGDRVQCAIEACERALDESRELGLGAP